MGVFTKLKNIFYDEMPLQDDISTDDELDKVNKIVDKKPKERIVEEKPKIETCRTPNSKSMYCLNTLHYLYCLSFWNF